MAFKEGSCCPQGCLLERKDGENFGLDDLTILELVARGNSEITVNGHEELVGKDNIQRCFDAHPSSILTPKGLLDRSRSLAEINATRARRRAIVGALPFYQPTEPYIKILKHQIDLCLPLTDLDENGLQRELHIGMCDRTTRTPVIPPEEIWSILEPSESFLKVVKFSGVKNGRAIYIVTPSSSSSFDQLNQHQTDCF